MMMLNKKGKPYSRERDAHRLVHKAKPRRCAKCFEHLEIEYYGYKAVKVECPRCGIIREVTDGI